MSGADVVTTWDWITAGTIVTAAGTLVLAIVTGLLAFVTKRMVEEMRDARLQSIRPELVLLPPLHGYTLTWDPPRNLQIIVWPDLPEEARQNLRTRLPVFQLKNLGSAPAADVTLSWAVTGPTPASLSVTGLFTRFGGRFDGRMIWTEAPTETGSQASATPVAMAAADELPYCSPVGVPPEEIDLPDEISGYLEAHTVASVSENPRTLEDIPAPGMSVKIGYRDLAGNRFERRFDVEAQIRSSRPWSTGALIPQPPQVQAVITFRVKRQPGGTSDRAGRRPHRRRRAV